MTVAKKWIQPSHYSDMIEERVSHQKCGLPTCSQRLAPPSSFRDIIDSVGTTKVDNTAGGQANVSSNYCSNSCHQSSTLFYQSLDASAPVTRSHANSLLTALQKEDSGDHIISYHIISFYMFFVCFIDCTMCVIICLHPDPYPSCLFS